MIDGMVGSILLIAVGLFDLIERYKDIEAIGVSSLTFWFFIYMYILKKMTKRLTLSFFTHPTLRL